MNEIREIPKDVNEMPSFPKVQETTAEYNDIKEIWTDFINSIKEFAETVADAKDMKPEVVEAREYGVKECAEVAKSCFTPEVIKAWGFLDTNVRNHVVQEYAKGIGDALGVDLKGIVWTDFPNDEGFTYGENKGDGYLYLNVEMLTNPAFLMHVVDTVAHETRHQLQLEAIDNPSKYPIDEASIREWEVGRNVYTPELPTAYDPWGYTYNPMETDARYFGEAMVRELTKDLITNA